MSDQIAVRETIIPGLFEVDLVLHGDSRGWFKENYQQAKMEALGLPHFEPVQNNFSYNADLGVTRGLHAEPWEKYVSVANGSVFCAWVDLRKGDSYGKVLTAKVTPDKAFFIPRGVANGYQNLEQNVTYTYLVNAHWSADAQYVSLNMFDPELNIDWPIKPDQAIVSEKDTKNPLFKDLTPMEFQP
jgi:dTDP-4-dehydrorhamnose 3,5-epimerase